MKGKILDDLLTAISEDFSVEELECVFPVAAYLKTFLEISERDAIILIRAVSERKRLYQNNPPNWRGLANIH